MTITRFIYIWVLFLTMFCGCNYNKPKLKYNNKLSKDKFYYVILMAGQSNMAGLGDIKDLTNPNLPDNVSFFNYSTDTQLKELSYNFGPEVGLAQRLNEEFPDLDFIFIKYAIGGSSIEEWLPNVESKIQRKVDFDSIYVDFLKTSNKVISKYNAKILAFLWMQGEQDACYESTSKSYEVNFTSFINTVRSDFENQNLPIVFGKINPKSDAFKYVQNIQNAQYNVFIKIPNTFYINTDSVEKHKDNIHYSSLGYLILGRKFGDVACEILKADELFNNKDN